MAQMQKVQEKKEMNCFCKQLFYTGWTCTLQLRGKSPTTSKHTAIHSFKLCHAPWLSRETRLSLGSNTSHQDSVQICVYWANKHISFIFTSTGDHRPPALFCFSSHTSYSYTHFILFTVRCVLLVFVSQSRAAAQMKFLWLRGYG